MAVFTTKANTLKVLEGAVKNAIILPQFSFTVYQWLIGKNNINNIWLNRPKWSYQKVIIRSSSINEDGSKESKAGQYLSVKNVIGDCNINEAIKNGAVLIVCTKKNKFRSKKVHIIKTKNVRAYLGEITSKFYKPKPRNIIAVTGTNGKTSVADFFYQILKKNNKYAIMNNKKQMNGDPNALIAVMIERKKKSDNIDHRKRYRV